MTERPYKKFRVEPDAPIRIPVIDPPERRGAIELPPALRAPPPINTPRLRGSSPWLPRRGEPNSLRLTIVAGILLVLLLLSGWLTLGLLAVRTSMAQANGRLDPRARAALSLGTGSIVSSPTAVLIIGVDEQANSDTLQVMRFDPDQELIATLSIPRDLRVSVPGYGDEKINAAYAAGGAALAIQTVQNYTGLRIEHVIVVDFTGLVGLVDAVGGITIDNPHALRSVFDGKDVRFREGRLDLDGANALAYARVRKNALSASDSDVSRGGRQQAVIQALRAKILSGDGFLRLRTVGGALGGAFATDLTLSEVLELGWVDQRTSRRLDCNLGGTPAPLDGQDMLIPDGAGNRRVLGEFLGDQAVQLPPTRSMFAAVCRTV